MIISEIQTKHFVNNKKQQRVGNDELINFIGYIGNWDMRLDIIPKRP